MTALFSARPGKKTKAPHSKTSAKNTKPRKNSPPGRIRALRALCGLHRVRLQPVRTDFMPAPISCCPFYTGYYFFVKRAGAGRSVRHNLFDADNSFCNFRRRRRRRCVRNMEMLSEVPGGKRYRGYGKPAA